MNEALPTPAGAGQAPLPRHVAIIMDGNGRWAKARGLPRAMGHRKGAEAVRAVVEASGELGIGYLTLYAFSSENWKRPADEVSDLMELLRLFIRREIAALHRNGVRLKIIGERERLAADIIALIEQAETQTKDNQGLTLVIALNYGSRREIAAAARAIAAKVASGTLEADAVDEDVVHRHLMTRDIPDPDLLIRTSGELRLSNFLLWQTAYSELVFTDVLWPDFDKAAFFDALAQYARRERRFGGR